MEEEVWYAQRQEDVFKALSTSENGLEREEAKKRLLQHGLNEASQEKKVSATGVLLRQFKNVIIIILLLAS
ncbi:hypothetical protein COY95_03475, partial [Candidatus Woesearchaeota archaeon CG_4_10_14_0_8_um_filter_47_5]